MDMSVLHCFKYTDTLAQRLLLVWLTTEHDKEYLNTRIKNIGILYHLPFRLSSPLALCLLLVWLSSLLVMRSPGHGQVRTGQRSTQWAEEMVEYLIIVILNISSFSLSAFFSIFFRVRVAQIDQKSEFWYFALTTGSYMLDEPTRQFSAL